MYESFYSLEEHPFNLTPDPDFIFISRNFGEALGQLIHAVEHREPLALLTGDVGTGKTTLCWTFLLRMKKDVRTALILNPLLSSDDLLRAIVQDFGIGPENRRAPWHGPLAGEIDVLRDASRLNELTREQLVEGLSSFLLEGVQADLTNVLVIDEAQNLSIEALELLSGLSELQTPKARLLHIIFSGQLELERKLRVPTLSELNQRIAVRCSLKPLSRADMVEYIYHRLWKAGGNQSLSFSKGAMDSIYRHSGGYPRLVNLICDRALRAGYNKRSKNINAAMVRTALGQLALQDENIDRITLRVPFMKVAAAIAVMIVLAGLAFVIRPWKMISGFLDQPPKSRSAAAEITATKEEIVLLPQEANPSPPAASLIAAGNPDTATSEDKGAAKESEVQTTEEKARYLLQVHSLRTQREADRALAVLARKGYPSLQRSIMNHDNTSWHVVYVGPFDDMDAAKEVAGKLLQREQLATILRSYPNRD
jgi:general secretion pathway protein A